MRKVFLDTNIVLDFILRREPYALDALAIFERGNKGDIELWVSSLTYSNAAYILRKDFTGQALYSQLTVLREMARVSAISEDIVDAAISLQANDFEDALQYFSAKSTAADCIVTRNLKDFTFSEIQVYSPRQFLEELGTD